MDEDSCCFSLSPEPVGEPHLWNVEEQLAARGEVHLEGACMRNPKQKEEEETRLGPNTRKTSPSRDLTDVLFLFLSSLLSPAGPAGTCAIFNPKMLHAATFRKSTRARKTLQVYYGHQQLQPGDYGDTDYMFEALNVQDKSVPHEERVGAVEEERVARLRAQAERMTKGREERMTMAEFTSIPPRFWRDHPDPEARCVCSTLRKSKRLFLRLPVLIDRIAAKRRFLLNKKGFRSNDHLIYQGRLGPN